MQKLKLIFPLALVCLGLTSNAQTPEKKSKAVVFKFTETWCAPCGDWGWQTADETIAQLGDKGYYIGVMKTSDPASMNANCAATFGGNYGLQHVPTFVVQENTSPETSGQVMSLINAFVATTPVASPAAKMSISGNTVSVTAKAKFWSAASGEYSMTAFLVEDSVLAEQASKTGIVAHHHIMRGSMSTNFSPWGEILGTATIAANAEFSKTYSIALNPEWKKAHLEVIMVIWKKNATTGKYEFVNAAKATNGATTGIKNIEGLVASQMYPNPTNGATTLQLSVKENMNLNIEVTDMLGRVVYTSVSNKLMVGINNLTIPSQDFSNGTYNVALTGNQGQRSTLRLVVSK